MPKSQIPMTNVGAPRMRVCDWKLEVGHWAFIGIWDLDIGI
jgi:hypothetical protein